MSQKNKMKEYNSNFIIILLVSFILLLSILFAYLQDIEKSMKNKSDYKQLLTKVYIYNQDFDMIFMRSYKDIDNDKISNITKLFADTLVELKMHKSLNTSSKVYTHIHTLESKYLLKSELIEQFKTVNARITNAVYSLHSLQEQIEEEKHDLEINMLLRDILFYIGQMFIGNITDMRTFSKEIILLEQYKNSSKSMKYFYMHTKRILEDITFLKKVLANAKGVEFNESIGKMRKLLEIEYADNQYEKNIITFIFFLFAFVLLLVVIHSYLKILGHRKEMYDLAYHDGLTTLPNRIQYDAYIDSLILRNSKQKKNFMLLFIDLDRFKVINDTLGHDVGDEILIAVAKRLRTIIGKKSFLARLGGDEFIAVIEYEDEKKVIKGIVEPLVIGIREQLSIRKYTLNITSSIGIVKYPEDAKDKHTLMKYADSAMYHAKDLGKDRYAFYNTQLSIELHRRLELEQELVSALKHEEFFLVFQPQYSLCSHRITGVEALVRWKSNSLGMVSSEEFISIAEDTGLIIELGYYIFKEACLQYMDWKRQGIEINLIGINISSVQLRQCNAFEKFSKIIKETGIDPHHIEIEITERYLMECSTKNHKILDDFRAIGCQISIDDFGTGYSSMSYLKSLAIDTIKIDKSFIGDLSTNKHNIEVSKAIILLSQTLGYKVIAEGIESIEQEKILCEYHCDMGQGYYFSKPLSSEGIVEFYQQNMEEKSK